MSSGIPLQQIVNALLRWRGNVKAVADELGVRRNSLYERIERAGLDLDAFRAVGNQAAPFPDMSGVSGVSGSNRSGTHALSGSARKSGSAPYQKTARPTTVPGMQQPVVEAPFGAARTKPKTVRIRPDQQEQLRAAKIEVIARFRAEVDEQTINDQFYEECFEEWLRGKLGENPAKANGGKK